MGKTGNQPCNAASRRAADVSERAVTAPVHALRLGQQSAQGIKTWLETRYGMDRKERMIVYGVAAGAPLALLASPLVGIGLAGALAAPGLFAILKRRRQESPSTVAPAIEERLEPHQPGAATVMASSTVQELEAKVSEQQAVLEALFTAYSQQQERINQLTDQRPAPRPASPAPGRQPSSLFSFSAPEAEKILSGKQSTLIRNGKIKVEDGQRLLVYGKQPKKAILGSAQVSTIVTGSPEEVWEQIGEQLGGEQNTFIRKCKKAMSANSKKVSVITLSEPERLAKPLSFQDSGLTSYDLGGVCYLKPEDNERHHKLLTALAA